MIIMALDHVRDFFHITAMTADPLDPATTSVPLFFTRWITHFCAPLFVLLSGISAYLAGQKKTPREAGLFLIKRGIWLIVVELVIVSFLITFNPLYNVLILQVIWAIGCSMVLLGLCSRSSYWLVLVIGLLLVLGHNLTDYMVLPQDGAAAALWKIFFTAFGSALPLGKNHLVLDLYAVLPYTGIMFCGYALGPIFRNAFPLEKRRRILVAIGFGMVALFIVLRVINTYGDPANWKLYTTNLRNLFSFLNASKYPPSLMYTCMTIGPGLLALAIYENIQSNFTRFVSVYGQVPFFYYVFHFFLIHLLCVFAFFASGYSTSQIADPNIPFLFRPVDFGYNLPVVYSIWILIVLSLYYPCKWFSKYKKIHREWWLSYL